MTSVNYDFAELLERASHPDDAAPALLRGDTEARSSSAGINLKPIPNLPAPGISSSSRSRARGTSCRSCFRTRTTQVQPKPPSASKTRIFVFTHNGEDFTEEHFASLCRFGYSNKRALHTIGFRGIGFKSTFSLGDVVNFTHRPSRWRSNATDLPNRVGSIGQSCVPWNHDDTRGLHQRPSSCGRLRRTSMSG